MIGPYYVTTSSRRHAAWGRPCDVSDFGKVTIDGRRMTVHGAARPAFQVYEKIRAHHGYRLTGNDTGFYSCRYIRGTRIWSFHSWAMALDINWLENPAGSKLVTDIPQPMIDDLLALRTESGARVFRWGGDWDWDGDWHDHSYVDAMHWEMVAHPLDIRTGIRGYDLSTPEGNDTMSLLGFNIGPMNADSVGGPVGDPAGDKAESLQRGLILRGYPLPQWGPDRFAGNETRTALAAWQSANGVTGEPGVIGPWSDAVWTWQEGGGGSTADVDTKIAAHAADGDAHSHDHDTGRTGGPRATS